jgi:ankyrin repeat protein
MSIHFKFLSLTSTPPFFAHLPDHIKADPASIEALTSILNSALLLPDFSPSEFLGHHANHIAWPSLAQNSTEGDGYSQSRKFTNSFNTPSDFNLRRYDGRLQHSPPFQQSEVEVPSANLSPDKLNEGLRQAIEDICAKIHVSNNANYKKALAEKCSSLVDRYIAHGASLDTPDQFGNTPLHIASRYRCGEIASLLIKKGATVDMINHKWNTPLHVTAELSHHKDIHPVIKILTEARARTGLRNQNGDTPLSLYLTNYVFNSDIQKTSLVDTETINMLIGNTPFLQLSPKERSIIFFRRAILLVSEHLSRTNEEIHVSFATGFTYDNAGERLGIWFKSRIAHIFFETTKTREALYLFRTFYPLGMPPSDALKPYPINTDHFGITIPSLRDLAKEACEIYLMKGICQDLRQHYGLF